MTEPESEIGVYSAVLRPGEAGEVSDSGLDADALDAWLSAHGREGDAFTYTLELPDGTVVVAGEGIVGEGGEAFYRLGA